MGNTYYFCAIQLNPRKSKSYVLGRMYVNAFCVTFYVTNFNIFKNVV